jgi:hypothetical protein
MAYGGNYDPHKGRGYKHGAALLMVVIKNLQRILATVIQVVVQHLQGILEERLVKKLLITTSVGVISVIWLVTS